VVTLDNFREAEMKDAAENPIYVPIRDRYCQFAPFGSSNPEKLPIYASFESKHEP